MTQINRVPKLDKSKPVYKTATIKIRPAKFSDLNELMRLAEEARKRSCYADIADLDHATFKATALECIAAQTNEPGGAMCLVADNGVHLVGMFVGVVRRLYESMNAWMAHNLIWYVSEGVNIKVGRRMLKLFEKWVDRAKGPVIIRIGLVDYIDDPKRVGNLLTRSGYRCSGLIFEKEYF
jgi:hypothetical protein